MRSLLLELVAVVVISIVLVCAALGLLPVPGEETATWLFKTKALLATAFTLQFPGARWAHPSAFAVISGAARLSLAIIGLTVVFIVAIGVPLGIVSATRSRSPVVQAARRAVSVVSSIPVLVIGTLIYVVLARHGITVREENSVPGAVAAAVAALVLGDRLLADIVQRVEIATRTILAEPYMRAVRAADLGFQRHLLQGLVPPVAEALTARSMFLISGAIVAELVFAVHGLGFTVEHALETSEDPRLILAAAMALVAIGLCFRVLHRASVALADVRRRR
jgi:ABC-type dipeptide/oligopeptide/nickel transport system permease component